MRIFYFLDIRRNVNKSNVIGNIAIKPIKPDQYAPLSIKDAFSIQRDLWVTCTKYIEFLHNEFLEFAMLTILSVMYRENSW